MALATKSGKEEKELRGVVGEEKVVALFKGEKGSQDCYT